MSRPSPAGTLPSLVGPGLLVVIASAVTAVAAQTVLETTGGADKMVSEPLRLAIVARLGGETGVRTDGLAVTAPLGAILATSLATAAAAWLAGAWVIARRSRRAYVAALAAWGRGWLWWLVPGVWEAARLAAFVAGAETVQQFLLTSPNFVLAFVLAGWAATFFTLCGRAGAATESGGRVPPALWAGVATYFVVFAAMNGLLWAGLRVPHGDSAMFEEHLWNLTRGKGFRSYIDGHVFLGEHFQVVHLLLLPAYLAWPSHLLLELCQSAALAVGAVPVFRMGLRHTDSRHAALALGAAYLLYVPMQVLDIDIVGKTFRLEAFGVMFLLFALDALDRGRLAPTATLLALALTAREDFAIVYGPLGLWVAFTAWRQRSADRRLEIAFGVTLAALSVAYVLFVVKVGIPWFRGGEPHYVSYFGRLGGSLDEVLRNVAANPPLLLRELATAKTLLYAVALLLPVGFLPLLSPGRLAVGLPLFVTVCLNELSQGPYHHFHAPLVPVLFWSAAAGLGHVPPVAAWCRRAMDARGPAEGDDARRWAAHFAWAGSFALGFFFTYTPFGILFWDAGSPFHWQKRYVPGPRAEAFPAVFAQIPHDARVAATDYVHPRFTHHDRSYDYARYGRAVNDGRAGAPPDSDFMVIDVTENDLGIARADQIPEYHAHPERWEVLPDETGGLFIVLKRRWAEGEREAVRRERAGAEEG